ncbi:dipeptide epimerase [Lutimonas sp.]|uniref:dipeptide epimerase n=1 Tax=Lutimonas sp. TaxID=1872403 RepID=UPI003D9AFA5A
MQLILRTYELKLQHTFTISRQSFDAKNVLIVELKDGVHAGFGEASENPYYNQSIEEMVNALLAVKNSIESLEHMKPEQFWEQVFPLLQGNMFALCALDIAYHDLYTKKKGLKLYEYWNYTIAKNIQTNFTIGIDTIENMLAKMRETPWPIYKIKLGTQEDLSIIRALRKETNAIFRIDANGAWDVQETLDNARELKKLGVEFLEQPLAADNIDGARKLFDASVLPIIADESCQIESDVEACHHLFHGVNIKLVKCGGLTPARRMIAEAKSKQMLAMVGCMTESTIGISAIAHLIPVLDYVDLDGALLLRKDIASGVSISKGEIKYAREKGTGAQLLDKDPIKIYL